MKRTVQALIAAVFLAGLGLASAPASAFFSEDEPSFGSRSRSVTASREARRSVRGTRSARHRAARHSRVSRRAAVRRTAASRRGAVRAAAVSGHGQTGLASYYWQGRVTANGERYNPSGMTAAHRTLPFGTRVKVTNHNNGRSVTVRINDRGPFIAGRIIDLSRGAAGVVGMMGAGVARVTVAVLGR